MSKSVGRITLSFSNDAVIEKQKFANVMNRYVWAMSKMHFKINSNSNEIQLTDDGGCDEPTVFPPRLISLEIFDPNESNEIRIISPEKATDWDLDNIEDCTSEEAELEEICTEISSAISKGYVVIGCDATHTNSMYSYQGTLKIFADGSGIQEYSLHHHIDPTKSIRKSFEHLPNELYR